MRSLSAWSLARVLLVALIWIVLVVVLAFLTPPGQFLRETYALVKQYGAVNVEVPITALKIWAALTPLIALGPVVALFVVWRRARRNAAA